MKETFLKLSNRVHVTRVTSIPKRILSFGFQIAKITLKDYIEIILDSQYRISYNILLIN
jgi:hypothetical protein